MCALLLSSYVCLTFWSMVCTCAVRSFGLKIEVGMSFSNEQRTTPRVRQPSSTVHGGRPADRLSEEPLIFLDFGILGIREPKIECSSQHLGFTNARNLDLQPRWCQGSFDASEKTCIVGEKNMHRRSENMHFRSEKCIFAVAQRLELGG